MIQHDRVQRPINQQQDSAHQPALQQLGGPPHHQSPLSSSGFTNRRERREIVQPHRREGFDGT
ncbi:hypothetical protein Dimus_002724, partial [Dionaea muscipula]